MIGTLTRHVAGAVAAWLVCVAEGLVGYLALFAFALGTPNPTRVGRWPARSWCWAPPCWAPSWCRWWWHRRS